MTGDRGTVRWFGESWGAPVNESPHVDTPVGQFCLDCHVKIEEGDRGLMIPYVGDRVTMEPHHLSCFLGIIGIPDLAADLPVQVPLTRGLALDLRAANWSVEEIAEVYHRDPEEVLALLRA